MSLRVAWHACLCRQPGSDLETVMHLQAAHGCHGCKAHDGTHLCSKTPTKPSRWSGGRTRLRPCASSQTVQLVISSDESPKSRRARATLLPVWRSFTFHWCCASMSDVSGPTLLPVSRQDAGPGTGHSPPGCPGCISRAVTLRVVCCADGYAEAAAACPAAAP